MNINLPHHTETGFKNPDDSPQHGFPEFIRWQFSRRGVTPKYKEVKNIFSVVEPDWEIINNPGPGLKVTWIGQSTLLVQMDGMNILTDPFFSEYSSPVQFAGPQRFTQVPISIDELPEIHAVLISHNHYDHLDRNSVIKLGNEPTWYIPLGLKSWFAMEGITNVVELDWWEERQFNDFTFVCTPARHFSGRSPFDRNKTLWCSWVVTGEKHRLWYAGDTGYSNLLKEIGNRYGPFNLAAIPIGAYGPEWFMLPVHLNPAQAVRVHEEVHAKHSIGIHWGTVILSDEPVAEPQSLLEKSLEENGIDRSAFFTLRHGETKILD